MQSVFLHFFVTLDTHRQISVQVCVESAMVIHSCMIMCINVSMSDSLRMFEW